MSGMIRDHATGEKKLRADDVTESGEGKKCDSSCILSGQEKYVCPFADNLSLCCCLVVANPIPRYRGEILGPDVLPIAGQVGARSHIGDLGQWS